MRPLDAVRASPLRPVLSGPEGFAAVLPCGAPGARKDSGTPAGG
ncbi:hypothetical protein ACX80L_11820 [Arthrobacter sp. MDT1-48-3]